MKEATKALIKLVIKSKITRDCRNRGDPFETIVCTVQKIDQKKMVMKPAILKGLPIKIV